MASKPSCFVLSRAAPPAPWMWIMLLVLMGLSLVFTPLLGLASGNVLLVLLPLVVAAYCAVGAKKTFKWRHQELDLTEKESEEQRKSGWYRIFILAVPLPSIFSAIAYGDPALMLFSIYFMAFGGVVVGFFNFGYGAWRWPASSRGRSETKAL